MLLTLRALHDRIIPVKREPVLDSDGMLLYQSNAMAGESGEVANVVKKMVRDGTEDDAALLDESGDVLFYMSRLLRRRGLTLEDAANALLNKLAEQAKEKKS